MSNPHAYVRTEMLEAKDPPRSQVGLMKWARENLFSSWLNTILTLISIYVVFIVFKALIPWVFGGVWDAGSLTECRTVLSAFEGGGHGAACWAVIEDRMQQLLFGFYPQEQYWRPLLALALFFVAIAPVLFGEYVPSKLLLFTPLYPFVAAWLIWGGSFWVPILVLAGFVVGFIAYRLVAAAVIPGIAVGVAVLAASIWWLVGSDIVDSSLNRMIGSARYEATLAEASAELETVGDEIAELEEARDAISDEIAVVVEERDVIAASAELIIAAHRAEDIPPRLEAAQAAMEADEGRSGLILWAMNLVREEPSVLVSTLSHELEEAQEVLEDAEGAGMDIPSDSELGGLQDQLLAMQDELTVMRNNLSDASRAVTLATSRQSGARLMENSLTALPEIEESLPDLVAAFAAAEDAAPSELLGYASVDVLPDGVSSEDRQAFVAYLDAKVDLFNANQAISTTYGRLALTGLDPVASRDIGGFMLAVIIGAAGIILSLPLGVLLALGRQSDLFIINKCSVIFIEVIRGVPLIVWLFTAQLLLNYFLPPGTNFDLLLRVIIMVTLFSAAYIAEVVRGGLAALPKGQYEGADSLGLNYWQSMRLIILPQALKISIPGIVSSFIGLFKDTTLVAFIGLFDPIGLSNSIRASTEWNGIYWELFIFIGFCFFLFCFSMSRYSQWLERKLHTGHR